jgi:hypothetical protein
MADLEGTVLGSNMLLVYFHSQAHLDEFFQKTVPAKRFQGTAWGSGWTAVIMSYQEEAIQQFLLRRGDADVIVLKNNLLMSGQVLYHDQAHDQKICVRCREDFTGRSNFIEVENDDDQIQVICKPCVSAVAGIHADIQAAGEL